MMQDFSFLYKFLNTFKNTYPNITFIENKTEEFCFCFLIMFFLQNSFPFLFP